MDNPYEPTPESSLDAPLRFSIWDVVVFLGVAAVVALNYATAIVPFVIPITDFHHAVFVAWPMAMLLHLRPLWASGPSTRLARREAVALGPVVLAGLMLAAFSLPWLAWFSTNPYEQFALHNRYFGQYGWVVWVLMLGVGLLPLFNITRLKRSKYWLISAVVLSAYSLNAYLVWHTSHAE